MLHVETSEIWKIHLEAEERKEGKESELDPRRSRFFFFHKYGSGARWSGFEAPGSSRSDEIHRARELSPWTVDGYRGVLYVASEQRGSTTDTVSLAFESALCPSHDNSRGDTVLDDYPNFDRKNRILSSIFVSAFRSRWSRGRQGLRINFGFHYYPWFIMNLLDWFLVVLRFYINNVCENQLVGRR